MATKPSEEEKRIWQDLDDALRRNQELLAGGASDELTEEEIRAIKASENGTGSADGCLFALLPLLVVAMGLAAGVLV